MHFVLGTAGHIDHGKSSLVQCLTGSDPDRLPEEKARGVTIELGFAHLSLKNTRPQASTPSPDSYEIGIVDVPGHSDFVNNMVAGVGALDLALFIIAADDGWMPQSEEHLHILTYLGISRVIIALTKADLCDDVPFSIEVLRDELQDTPLANAPIIPVSSITGEGIEDLKNALLDQLSTCPPRSDSGKPRIAIDRIFSPKGTGTVITGTLVGGSINIGDSLTLQPAGLTTKVRYIQNHNQSLNHACPGMRTALNLPDLPIAAPGKPGAHRGNTLTSPTCGTPTRTLDIHLRRLARPIPGTKPRPLRHLETVVLHHGSTRCHARVILHNQSHINPGENCLAQLRLDSPVFLLTGDRIVLRDGSQQSTLAGGTVLDAQPSRQGFRSEKRAAFLQPRADHPDDPSTHLTTLLARDGLADAQHPLPNNPFSEDAIRTCIDALLENKTIVRQGKFLLDATIWTNNLTEAEKTIQAWHTSRPDLPSMPLDNLAAALPHCPPEIFPHLIDALESRGYQKTAKSISSSSHTLTLPDEIAAEAQSILDQLNRSGLQPPNKQDLTSTAREQQALNFLIRSGQIIELDPKVVITSTTRDNAANAVRAFISSHPDSRATASELRQHLSTTRKILMPLLEHLDSLGITQRTDNYRKLL